jgi:hypothetical protein
MNLVASVVTYTVEAANADELHTRVETHLLPAARALPGYHGFLLIDQGNDQRLALIFFETPEQVMQAQQALTPIGKEHTYALMSGPATGSLGRVLIHDGLIGND